MLTVRLLDYDLVFFDELGRNGDVAHTHIPSSGARRRRRPGSMSSAFMI